MLARILQSLKGTQANDIYVVINKDHEHLIRPITQAFSAKLCFQEKTLKGTAAAVQSIPLKECKTDHILIVNGDHPFIQTKDLKKMREYFHKESADVCIGSFEAKNPGDYGRIVRRDDKVVCITEKEALTSSTENIREVNAGIYLVKKHWLQHCLPHINQQKSPSGESLLTNIVSFSVHNNKKVVCFSVSEDTAFGVNSQQSLAFATKKVFTLKLHHLMNQGVIIIDTFGTYIEENVQVGQGSVIYPGVYLKGKTSIGSLCAIETNCFITDSVIQDLVLIRSGSYLESVEIGAQSMVGPYARLRPGTKIGERCRIGNFVEMKKTNFGDRSKAGHFSYLGDTQVGEDVNIGCGVVTSNLNLEGEKHQTNIEDHAFVGSGTQLIAPVALGKGCATGAGSVITKNVPAQSLALSRSPQKHRKHRNK